MAMNFGTSGSLPSGTMEIGIALVLHDRFSNQAGQASSAIRQLQNDAKNAIQANLQTAANLGRAGLGAFGVMAAGISDMVSYGAEFIDTMTTVEAITQASAENMTALNEISMELGKTTMFSSQDIASGMKYLAMAGNTAEEIESMIKGATYAAGATGMALGGKGGAADVITNVMRTFQLYGEEAALWVGDVMTNATLSANISMQDLAASIRYAAADMTNLGYTLPEVSAAIGTLGNMGIQGSMAGTALANMARYLNKSISDPKYKGHKFLEQAGLNKEDLVDSQGNLRSLYEIMTKIKAATANMDATERNLFTTGVFGVRGNRAAMALMRDMEGFRELYNKVSTTPEGYAEQIVEKRMSTLAGQLNAMKSVFQNFKAAFTKALTPLIPVLKVITNFLDGLRIILGTAVGKIIASITVGLTALIGIGSVLTLLRAKWRLLHTDTQVTGSNMFKVLIGGWKGATMAATEYMNILRGIKMQQFVGVTGNPATAGVAMGGLPGYKAYAKINPATGAKSVQYRYHGRFTSPRTDPVLAGYLAGQAGSATRSLPTILRGTTSIGKGLVSVLKGIPALFGGLPGILTTIAFIGIPAIIGAIGKNRDAKAKNTSATDENTYAVNTLAGQYKTESERIAAGKSLDEKEELRLLANALTQFIAAGGKPINITLNTNNGSQTISLHEMDSDIPLDYSLQ